MPFFGQREDSVAFGKRLEVNMNFKFSSKKTLVNVYDFQISFLRLINACNFVSGTRFCQNVTSTKMKYVDGYTRRISRTQSAEEFG